MSDRELLELAAKAAGMNINFDSYDDFGVFDGITESYWNPLTDDGDALRLAVKLGLLVDVSNHWSKASDGITTEQNELHGTDPYAATRRAIVRAAAEIGKDL